MRLTSFISSGFFGATVDLIFTALPQELIIAIAELALLGTIGNRLVISFASTTQQDKLRIASNKPLALFKVS
ncbi:hypothetical protein H1P_440030 [Hyella patelloides LEGE 07179]|uniref:Uncharacterized protein n=2 Tax=Hyella TaxID=945733 RepID=A0A563VY47_9CYAN|nr:hypothetical protein H1P_440030 [Hyella patelloides LEGE 07179]